MGRVDEHYLNVSIGEWPLAPKEKPMDRTEEAKALREFVKERGLGKNWLKKTVKKLRKGKPFKSLTKNQVHFVDMLCAQGHIIMEYNTKNGSIYAGNIVWANSIVYRLKDSYTLPTLETPPRFKEGTWLAFTPTGSIFKVISRAEVTRRHTTARPSGDWCGTEKPDGTVGYLDAHWDDIQELPPMPDKDALAKQGYELTMEVADCSKEGHGHLYSDWCSSDPKVLDSYPAYDGMFNGWRWLVRKIEKKEEETEQVSIVVGSETIEVPTGERTMIAVTKDGEKIKIYINGSLVKATS